jgi:hypothetical protein
MRDEREGMNVMNRTSVAVIVLRSVTMNDGKNKNEPPTSCSRLEDRPSVIAAHANRDKVQMKRIKNGVEYFFMMWNMCSCRCQVREILSRSLPYTSWHPTVPSLRVARGSRPNLGSSGASSVPSCVMCFRIAVPLVSPRSVAI